MRQELAINLKQLRFFVTVVELGNITRAAERLNVAQTALGQQIRQLEDSLGVELLIRHSRGTTLTEPGEVLYQHAISILQSVSAARRDVIASTGVRSKLTLGVTPSVMTLISADLLELAREELPQIDLQLIEDLSFNLTDALKRGELDVLIASESTSSQGLEASALIEEELLFVSDASSWMGGQTIRFEDAIASDLALVGERDIPWQIVHSTADRLSMRVNVAFKVQSIPAIKALVAKGAATSVMPYGVIAEEVNQGTLFARRIVQPAIKRTLLLSRMSGRTPFLFEDEFMHFVDGAVGKLVGRMHPYGKLINSRRKLETTDCAERSASH